MKSSQMAHGESEQIVGKLFFRNMDDEWEQFPTDEELQAAEASAWDLQKLGFAIICQLCNKCATLNSAGKA